MASEPMAAAEQRLADYAQRIEQIQQRAEQSQEQIKSMRARSSSPDGTVAVVLAPGGRLENLTLTPQAMRLGHERLAATIRQTIQAAHADAAQQTQAALQPLIGESQAMDFLKEQLDTGLAEEEEQAPPSRRRPRDDDDDSFGGPILRRN